ncbi:DUF3515 family protein [Parafrankia soli]|uniref:DUF3515 family protein n=1 Tax=Parafrankia soli TaxID=2599596 RepID=UPI003B589960
MTRHDPSAGSCPRARAARRVRLLPLCIAGLTGLAGPLTACGGPGPVAITGAPAPAGADRASCEALTAALPDSLGDGLDRREVEPPAPTTAAFGSDPVVLTCGASGVAATYRPDSTLSEVDQVAWFTEDVGSQVRYSTPTRTPQVVLTLPADRQAFEVLVALAPAVRAHTRSTTA